MAPYVLKDTYQMQQKPTYSVVRGINFYGFVTAGSIKTILETVATIAQD